MTIVLLLSLLSFYYYYFKLFLMYSYSLFSLYVSRIPWINKLASFSKSQNHPAMKPQTKFGSRRRYKRTYRLTLFTIKKIDQNNLFLTKPSAKILKGAHEQPHFRLSLILLSYLVEHVLI